MKEREIELLSPAKDIETGIAAVDSGADALYIGAPKFSARSAAGNNLGDIGRLCKYAHFFGVKVYAALNTILRDGELDEAQNIAFGLSDAGIDALIIQDMGLLEVELPNLPLFASTQTNNVTPDKVRFLEDVGFSRVILARELSLKELSEIRKAVSIGLEVFVHGSLCVSYSGQCYMSMATTGRSANRGECSQPCRLPYEMVDAKGNVIVSGKYLLSLKDLNLSGFLEELMDVGIDSFKIEGRLKDKAYVINNTAYYRQRIDKIIEKRKGFAKASSGTVSCKFNPDPSKTFNRGYTSYFLQGFRDSIASPLTPKFIGEPVGKVKSSDQGFIEVDSPVELHNGDGLTYFDQHDRLNGFNLNKVDGKKLFPYKLAKMPSVGTELFRNHDKCFLDSVEKGCERKINIDIRFYENAKGFGLDATDEDGNQCSAAVDVVKVKAEKPGEALRQLKESLSKTGGTSFQVKSVLIETPIPWFLRMSEINSLRRQVVANLTDLRLGYKKTGIQRTEKEKCFYPEKELYFQANVMNRKAKEFYQRHGAVVVEQAFEKLEEKSGRVVMTTKHCIRLEQGICKKQGQASSLDEAPLFIRDEGYRYKLEFDCKECQMKIIFLNRRNL